MFTLILLIQNQIEPIYLYKRHFQPHNTFPYIPYIAAVNCPPSTVPLAVRISAHGIDTGTILERTRTAPYRNKLTHGSTGVWQYGTVSDKNYIIPLLIYRTLQERITLA